MVHLVTLTVAPPSQNAAINRFSTTFSVTKLNFNRNPVFERLIFYIPITLILSTQFFSLPIDCIFQDKSQFITTLQNQKNTTLLDLSDQFNEQLGSYSGLLSDLECLHGEIFKTI